MFRKEADIMLKLGEIQELEVIKCMTFGVYLAEDNMSAEKVLLPAKEVPVGTVWGNILEVFLYKDSEDRLIATVNPPALTIGKLAVLKVKQITKIGAFLDWGLAKDLLLPFKEQTHEVHVGEEVLVSLYIDKSERLCATMKIYSFLSTRAPYQIGDEVNARIYELSEKHGLFAAVEDQYSALIQKKDMQGNIAPGDTVKVRITQIREDGRLCVTPRKKAYQEIGSDSEIILERIKDNGGALPFDDHADPEVIKKEFSISKAAFKRAVGHLLKEGLVEITDGKILLR